MKIKSVETIRWSMKEANDCLGKDACVDYWKFLVKELNYKDISFDRQKEELVFSSYIPIKNVISEIADEIKEGIIPVEKCRICDNHFNINKEEGIFGDPQNLKRFICKLCSENLSARVFYEKHLVC